MYLFLYILRDISYELFIINIFKKSVETIKIYDCLKLFDKI